MKVLNVVYSLGKGGTERAAQNFATGYAENGHSSRLLFTQADGPRRDDLAGSGIPVHDLRSAEDLELLKDWAPDVVHIHSHGLREDEMLVLTTTFRMAKFLETNVFSKPSAWEKSLHASFQLSSWCNYLYVLRGGDAHKASIVPYPVETSRFSPASREAVRAFRMQHELSDDDFVIGRVGQSFDGKWSNVLIDVFEDLRRSDQNVRLLVVNPPNSIRARIEASEFSRDGRIVESIIGDDALSTCYSAMDVLLHIARQGESFGMVLAESLLCETPVVTLATPWGDNSQGEVIGHGIGGFVAARIDALPSIMKRLKSDPSLRKRLGVSGRKHITESFSSAAVSRLALKQLETRFAKRSAKIYAAELLRSSEGTVGLLDVLFVRHRTLLPFLKFTTGYSSKWGLPAAIVRMVGAKSTSYFGCRND